MVLKTVFPILAAALAAGCGGPDVPQHMESRLPDRVDYGFHIKPLIADRCYACHGPDDGARQGGLHLYSEEGALRTKLPSGRRAIVPGRLRKSEAIRRIFSDDPEVMMPPPESNLALSAYDKALIARWIKQGAEWKPHWAFIPSVMPEVPAVEEVSWASGPIDRFVLARLEREGLAPSPVEGKERLLRRVTFDLTGIPPTIAEIDAFLADTGADAYERVVDRLLASPAFGERMATKWMDAARYADSHGYHSDGVRFMWPWRDWVIDAFNRNMPYDEFVTWQMAGDLLPEPSAEQRLATAFHRNHPMTAEGGVIDEEYRVDYVADRANTTGRAILGMTMECARCHDHKFDPISQKEYYQFFAFFNNVRELGLSADDGNAGPLVMLMTNVEERALKEARAAVLEHEKALGERAERVREQQAHMEYQPDRALLGRGLVDHYPFDALATQASPNVAGGRLDAEVLGTLDVIDGPRGGALLFDDDYDYMHLPGAGLFDRTGPFSVGLWLRLDEGGAYARIVGNSDNKHTFWRGWELYVDSLDHVAARLIHALPHNYLHVRANEPLALSSWTHVAVTYDGSSRAEGLRLYLDGKEVPVRVEHDRLYKSFLPVGSDYEVTDRAPRVARSYRAFGGDDGIFTGAMDDLRMYDRRLSRAEAGLLAATSDEPVLTEGHRLEAYLLHEDAPYRDLMALLRASREAEEARVSDMLEVMVMEEMDEPRQTHVLDRGLYDQPAESVGPAVPSAFGPWPDSLPANRLGLAQWLFSGEHPLTARVAVNRYWQMLFGQGIVATSEDFGNQGTLPSHPELLDWLASTFVESGWDTKALLKTIVMSATYRQSSAYTNPEDPSNVLLARGPRYRMPAEMIRDNALAVSGLLVDSVGGPSVKPYQPPGLWIEKGNFSTALLRYQQDTGDDLYRRSLYTFIRRTSPPPSMTIFDTPDRNFCVVRRQNTNTPLQALVLLNDPQYVEAARVLAERMQKEGGSDTETRIRYGFRLATSRRPTQAEASLLADVYEEERRRFARAPADADSLLAVGERPRDPALDRYDTAAFAVVAGLLLNHDEAYTKR